jgi:competence protein ComEC
VDYVVATHPHPDHAKGLGFILKDFRVQQFWDNGAQLSSQWYSNIRWEAKNRGLYRHDIGAGSTAMRIDGVHLERFHPTATYQPAMKRRGGRENTAENNRSLVLKLTYGGISFLFTGDVEQEAESFLLQNGHDLRATVLKVPHHGSRTSSSEPFVRAVNPRVAVFSVQRDGRFGHPHPLVVERYHALSAHVYRTDEHGAITIRTNGQSIRVVPYIGTPLELDAPAVHRLAETHTSSTAEPR